MDFKINIREEALKDLIRGYLWYEDQKKGLGSDFVAEFESCLKYLKRHPEAFPKKKRSLRELNLRTFPYLIIYTVEGSLATVLAIFNSYLDPNKKPSL